MRESKFTNYQVKNIGDTLQTYMQKENISEMSADMLRIDWINCPFCPKVTHEWVQMLGKC